LESFCQNLWIFISCCRAILSGRWPQFD
jgi:hypothetical protein